jgi:enoyl-CoA hydratase/carnithine racemase
LSAEASLACGLATEIAPQEEWSALVDGFRQRCSALSPLALKHMLDLTSNDSRADDIAAIVTTAGRPGLKDRIMAYRDRMRSR